MAKDGRDLSKDIERDVPVEREKVRELSERNVSESVDRGLNNSLENSRQECEQRLGEILNFDKTNDLLSNELKVSVYNGSQLGISIDNNLPIVSETRYEEVSGYLSEDKFNGLKSELRDSQREIDERVKDFNSDKLYASLSPTLKEAEKIREEDSKLQDAVKEYRAATSDDERNEVLSKNSDRQDEIKQWDEKLARAETAKSLLEEKSNEIIKAAENNRLVFTDPKGREVDDVREKYATAVAERNIAEKKLELTERKLQSELKDKEQREIADKCVEKELEKMRLNSENRDLANSRKDSISSERQKELSDKAEELKGLGKELSGNDFSSRGITNVREIEFTKNKIEISRLNEEQKDLKSQFCLNSSMKVETASSLLNNFVRGSKSLHIAESKLSGIEKREESKNRFDRNEEKVQNRIVELTRARSAEINLHKLNDGKNNISSVLERYPASKIVKITPRIETKRDNEKTNPRYNSKETSKTINEYDRLTEREKELVKNYRDSSTKNSALYGLRDKQKEKIVTVSKELDREERELKEKQDTNNVLISSVERDWEHAKNEDKIYQEIRDLNSKPKSEDKAVNTGALLEEAKEKTNALSNNLKALLEKDNSRLEKENDELRKNNLPENDIRIALNTARISENKQEIKLLGNLRDEAKNTNIKDLREERAKLSTEIKDAKDRNKEITKELKLSKEKQTELNNIALRYKSVDLLDDAKKLGISEKEREYVENKINISVNEKDLLKNQLKNSAKTEHSRQEKFDKLTKDKSDEERREIKNQAKELHDRQKSFKPDKNLSKQEERLRSLSGYVDRNSPTITGTVSKMLDKNESKAKEILEKANLSRDAKEKASTLYERMRAKDAAERENAEISKTLNKLDDIRNQDFKNSDKIAKEVSNGPRVMETLRNDLQSKFSIEQKIYISNINSIKEIESRFNTLDRDKKMEALEKVANMRSINEELKRNLSPKERQDAEKALKKLDSRDFEKLAKAKEILRSPENQQKIPIIDTDRNVDEKINAIDAQIKAINEVLLKNADDKTRLELNSKLEELKEMKNNSMSRASAPVDEKRLEEAKSVISSIPGIAELKLTAEELKYLALAPDGANAERDIVNQQKEILNLINREVTNNINTHSIIRLCETRNDVNLKLQSDKMICKAEKILNGRDSLTDKQINELRGYIETINMRANNLYRSLDRLNRKHTDNVSKLTSNENKYDSVNKNLMAKEVASIMADDKLNRGNLSKIEEIRQLREISDRASKEIFSHLKEEYRPSVELIKDRDTVMNPVSFFTDRLEPTYYGTSTELKNDNFRNFVNNNVIERDTTFKETLNSALTGRFGPEQEIDSRIYDKTLSLHKEHDKALINFSSQLKDGVYGKQILSEMERDLASYRVQVRGKLEKLVADGKFSINDVEKTVDRLSESYSRFQTEAKFFSYSNRDDLGRPINHNSSIIKSDEKGSLTSELYDRSVISRSLSQLALEESKIGIDVTRTNTDLYGSKIDKNIIDKYLACDGKMLIDGKEYLREQDRVYNVKESEKSAFYDMGSIIGEFKNVFFNNNDREELKAANTVETTVERTQDVHINKAAVIMSAIVSSLWSGSRFGRAFEKSKSETEKTIKKMLGIKDDDKEDSVDNVSDDEREERREAEQKAANIINEMDEERRDSFAEKIDRLSQNSNRFLSNIGDKLGAFGRFAQKIGRSISDAISSIRNEKDYKSILETREKIDRFNKKHRDSEKLSFIDKIKYNKLNKTFDDKLVARIKDHNHNREKYEREGNRELADRHNSIYNSLIKIFNSREEHIKNANNISINSKEFISSYSANILNSYTGYTYNSNYPVGMPI